MPLSLLLSPLGRREMPERAAVSTPSSCPYSMVSTASTVTSLLPSNHSNQPSV